MKCICAPVLEIIRFPVFPLWSVCIDELHPSIWLQKKKKKWRAGGRRSLSQCCSFRLRAPTLIAGLFFGHLFPSLRQTSAGFSWFSCRDPPDAPLAAYIRISLSSSLCEGSCALPRFQWCAHCCPQWYYKDRQFGGGGKRVCLIWQFFVFFSSDQICEAAAKMSWWLSTNHTVDHILSPNKGVNRPLTLCIATLVK